jgi:hypothetical protein
MVLHGVTLELKRSKTISELFNVEPRIDKSAEGHISAAAAERLKIGDFSHLAGAGNSSGSVGRLFPVMNVSAWRTFSS